MDVLTKTIVNGIVEGAFWLSSKDGQFEEHSLRYDGSLCFFVLFQNTLKWLRKHPLNNTDNKVVIQGVFYCF